MHPKIHINKHSTGFFTICYFSFHMMSTSQRQEFKMMQRTAMYTFSFFKTEQKTLFLFMK